MGKRKVAPKRVYVTVGADGVPVVAWVWRRNAEHWATETETVHAYELVVAKKAKAK